MDMQVNYTQRLTGAMSIRSNHDGANLADLCKAPLTSVSYVIEWMESKRSRRYAQADSLRPIGTRRVS